jgi:hypothetical protein
MLYFRYQSRSTGRATSRWLSAAIMVGMLAWAIGTAGQAGNITQPDPLLSRLGMDVRLLDRVKDWQPLADSDREPFYALLAAAASAEPEQLLREAKNSSESESFPAARLFADPAGQRGRLVRLAGVARRVVRVPIDDHDAAKLKLDHYYEIDLFTADSQGNPVVLCVPELPAGMTCGEPPNYCEPVEAAGFFFKVWRYPVTTAGQFPAELPEKVLLQAAALVVGQSPIWHPRAKAAVASSGGGLAAAMLLLVLAGVWLLLLHLGRSDREFFEKFLAKRLQ